MVTRQIERLQIFGLNGSDFVNRHRSVWLLGFPLLTVNAFISQRCSTLVLMKLKGFTSLNVYRKVQFISMLSHWYLHR